MWLLWNLKKYCNTMIILPISIQKNIHKYPFDPSLLGTTEGWRVTSRIDFQIAIYSFPHLLSDSKWNSLIYSKWGQRLFGSCSTVSSLARFLCIKDHGIQKYLSWWWLNIYGGPAAPKGWMAVCMVHTLIARLCVTEAGLLQSWVNILNDE